MKIDEKRVANKRGKWKAKAGKLSQRLFSDFLRVFPPQFHTTALGGLNSMVDPIWSHHHRVANSFPPTSQSSVL